MTLRPRRAAIDLLVLAAVFGVAYTVGLTTHGPTNWQESIRLLVARQMGERTDWIVPTLHGTAYLAKPPLIYWLQLLVAEARGTLPSLFELRLVVALAGVAAVLTTYWAGRVLLAHADSDERQAGLIAQHGAWWGALFLGSGVLATRSARIGELDGLLMPTVAGAIAAGALAALPARRRAWTRLCWTGLAMAFTAGAALAKGPAGLMVVGAALVGGGALAAGGGARPGVPFGARARLGLCARTAAVAALCAGAALLALRLWADGVAARAGAEVVARAVRTETGENLRLFHPRGIPRTLEGLAYGAGLGSIGAFLGTLRLAWARRRPTPGLWTVLAWVWLSAAVFAVTTKGSPRYLTPLWPGMSVLAGYWFAGLLATSTRPDRRRVVGATLVVLLTCGQAWWYARGRERLFADRTPRGLCGALVELDPEAIRPGRVGVMDAYSPALDYELGIELELWRGDDFDDDAPHARPRPIRVLANRLARGGGTYVLLVRERVEPEEPPRRSPEEQLAEVGLESVTIDTPRWIVGGGDWRISARRVSASP